MRCFFHTLKKFIEEMTELTFSKHTACYMIALFFIWAVPMLIGVVLGDTTHPNNPTHDAIAIIVLLVLLATHIVSIFLYYKLRYHLFALPLSHFLFPIFLSFAMIALTFIRDSSGRLTVGLMALAFIYFLPIALITLAISTIVKVKMRGNR